MSKELEALKVLNKYRNNYYNSSNEEENNVANAINTILPKLIPPTSDEVCKALENYFGYPHYYQDNFFYRSDGMKYIWAVKRSGVLEIGHAYETLPTHLFIILGKFYESEVSKDV